VIPGLESPMSEDPDVPLLSSRFEDALVLAARLHARQRRKGSGVPYVSHLLGVASLVLEDGGDEDQAIAALLHDAVEDQGGPPTLEVIRARFGDTVAGIVLGCTDSDTIPKPPWRERKERYIAHLRHAPVAVRRVSAADKLHNARTIVADLRTVGDSIWSRFTADRDGTLWYYRSLVAVFKETGGGPLADALERVVAEMMRLSESPLK
jgi:(p)ppGpp synthase/HD superfamily hydrolase